MFSKNMLQKIKGIILGLVLVLGISVAMAGWAPPGGTPSAGNNEKAPLNVGTIDQIKDAGLIVNAFVASENSSLIGDATIGDTTLGVYSKLKIAKLSQANPVNDAVSYPASLCIGSDGVVIICSAGGTASVDLTVDQPTIATSEVTTISQGVTLSWTTQNLVGATCTSTQNNGATGFTTTPSYAGGTDAATIEKFGVSTFTISCTPQGGGTPATDSVTVTATGIKTYTASGSFTPTTADFKNPTTFTVKAVGGGGGGITYGGVTGDYTGTAGGNGSQSTVTYNASTFITAASGGGGTFNPGSGSTVASLGPINGTAGAGSSGAAPGYSLGSYASNQNCGGGLLNIVYGGGGAAGCSYNTAVNGGAGGAQSTTSGWTSGAYTFTLGAGGTAGNVPSGGGQAQVGGKGAVQFTW